MKTRKKGIKISLVVVIGIMLAMSTFAPAGFAFVGDEVGETAQIKASESAVEKEAAKAATASPAKAQKEEPKTGHNHMMALYAALLIAALLVGSVLMAHTEDRKD